MHPTVPSAAPIRPIPVTLSSGEWVSPPFAPVLIAIILLAATGTLALVVIGLLSYLRRPTFRYRVLTVVLGLLVVRSIVGMATVFDIVPMTLHHLLEHGLDLLVAGLLLYLIYREGTPTGSETGQEGTASASSPSSPSSSSSSSSSTSASASSPSSQPTSPSENRP